MIRSLRKLYILFSPKSRWKILLLFGLMVVGSFLELLGIGSIPLFVSILTNPDKISKYPMVESIFGVLNINSRKDLMYFGAIFMVSAFILKNLFIVYFAHYRTKFIFNQKIEFEQRLFHAYLFSPYDFILNNHSSRLLRNIGGEINMIITRVLLPLMKILLDSFLIITILALLIVVNPLITLAVIGILLVAGFVFLQMIRKKIKEYGRVEQKHRAQMIKSVLQGLGGVKESRVLNRENNFFMKMNRSATKLAKAGYYREFVGAIPKPFIETIAIVVFLLISMLLYLQGKSMDSLLTTLALFGAAFYRLMPTSQQMVTQISLFQYGLVSIDPVYRDMRKLNYLNKYNVTLNRKKPEKFPFEKEISLNNITFSYPNTTSEVIKGLDLKIKKGSVIAFVGPSGAGKTTLVDLILGLLIPTRGSITVDNKNIQENLNGWNMNIGYIPQNIYLTDDSIKNNIAFGLEEEGIDENRLNQALKEAQLQEMVETLPRGTDTIIGEHGTRISGGQRQRLGIARALYNQPELLIMDEATSSLDSITEKFIIESIEMLKSHRTIIMIAHRLTTVKNADIIYFMKNGRIYDSGTYDELLEKNKEFKALAGMS